MLIAFVHLQWMGTPPYVHHFYKGDNFVREFYSQWCYLEKNEKVNSVPHVMEKSGKFDLFFKVREKLGNFETG